MSLLHGRLPEYPIFQRFLESGFEINTCAKCVPGNFPPPSQTPGYEASFRRSEVRPQPKDADLSWDMEMVHFQ